MVGTATKLPSHAISSLIRPSTWPLVPLLNLVNLASISKRSPGVTFERKTSLIFTKLVRSPLCSGNVKKSLKSLYHGLEEQIRERLGHQDNVQNTR